MFKIKSGSKGFTLLELLVVVLIIGILAAIALPQYKLAVDKSEFAKLQTYAKSLADAYNRYYLLHNAGTSSFAELDVDLSYNQEVEPYSNVTCRIDNDIYCCLAPRFDDAITCGKTDYSIGIWINLVPTKRINWCVAKQNDSRAVKLCDKLWNRTKKKIITGYLTLEGVSSSTHIQYPI